LDRWETEGGASAHGACLGQAPLSEQEAHILQRFDTAFVSGSNGLPTRSQHELLEHSFEHVELGEAASLKKRIARFIHLHRDDAGGAK
jgi:hypothetical protein